MSEYVIRITGAHHERIDGVGLTVRGQPFQVKSKDYATALLKQESRFKKPTAAEVKAYEKALKDAEAAKTAEAEKKTEAPVEVATTTEEQ